MSFKNGLPQLTPPSQAQRSVGHSIKRKHQAVKNEKDSKLTKFRILQSIPIQQSQTSSKPAKEDEEEDEEETIIIEDDNSDVNVVKPGKSSNILEDQPKLASAHTVPNPVDLLNQKFSNIIKLGELEQGTIYPIKEFKYFILKSGEEKLVIDIGDNSIVFLPDRFNRRFSRKDVEYMNTTQVAFIYHGLKSMGGGKSFHDLTFTDWHHS